MKKLFVSLVKWTTTPKQFDYLDDQNGNTVPKKENRTTSDLV